jgi:serine/threonine-protein kinase
VLFVILLAALVLVCSGVVSYWRNSQALSEFPRTPVVTSGAAADGERDDLALSSYRRGERLLPEDTGETTTSEGRQRR